MKRYFLAKNSVCGDRMVEDLHGSYVDYFEAKRFEDRSKELEEVAEKERSETLRLYGRIAGLEANLQDEQKKSEGLREETEILRKRLFAECEDSKKLRASQQKDANKMMDLEKQLREAERDVSEYRRAHRTLTESLESEVRGATQLRNELAKAREEIEKLQTRAKLAPPPSDNCADCFGLKNALEKERDLYKAECTELRIQRDAARTIVKLHTDSRNHGVGDFVDLKRRNDNLESECKRLTAVADMLYTNINQHVKDYSQLAYERDDWKMQANDTIRKLNTTRDQLEAAESRNKTVEGEKANLANECSALHKALNHLKMRLGVFEQGLPSPDKLRRADCIVNCSALASSTGPVGAWLRRIARSQEEEPDFPEIESVPEGCFCPLCGSLNLSRGKQS